MQKELIKELGELREKCTLGDTSEENQARIKRIKEIMNELNLKSKPRKTRRPCRYIPK